MNLQNRLLRIFIRSAGLWLLLPVAFLRIYAPIRARRLQRETARFRGEFRATAEAIDARFNHQDKVVNGIKWHYVDEGPRDGDIVLFLHGLPEGWYCWRYILPLIDPTYRLIAIDMKGYGRSDKQDDNYDWHVVAQQTLDLVDSIGDKKFYVVGHDWGSLIGSVLVVDHPDRILGFVRMQADLIPRTSVRGLARKPQFLLFQLNWLATFMMQDARWFIDLVYPPRMASPFVPEDRGYLIYEFSRPGVAAQVPKYFKLKNWDLDTAIRKICKEKLPFPILALQADRDPHQPISSFSHAESECPNIELKWITNASHFDNFDQPEQVADAINRFVHSSNR